MSARRLRWCSAALVVALGGLLFPAGAVAGVSTIDAGRFFPVAGPGLAGSEVLWSEPASGGGLRLLRGAPGAGGPRVVFRDPVVVENNLVGTPVLAFVSSRSEVLLSRVRILFDPRDPNTTNPLMPMSLGVSRLLEGGALEQLRDGVRGKVFDLDGSVGVYPGQKGLRVRDFSKPPETAFEVEGLSSAARIAGRYLAALTRDRTDLVVYDLERRAEVYRVAGGGPDLVGFGGVDGAFDVQSDGKVAFAYDAVGRDPMGSPARTALGWASPAEPVLHPLGDLSPVRTSAAVSLARDVVVFNQRRREFTRDFPSAGDALGVAPLSGQPRLVVSHVAGIAADQAFDFDGERVTWLEATCAGPRIRVAAIDDLLASPLRSAQRRCGLRFDRRPKLSRKGVLSLDFDCVGFSRVCYPIHVVLRTARRYRLGARAIKRGTSVASRSPTTSAPRIRLSRLGRRLARKPGALKLRVAVDLSGGDVWERRQRIITLR